MRINFGAPTPHLSVGMTDGSFQDSELKHAYIIYEQAHTLWHLYDFVVS